MTTTEIIATSAATSATGYPRRLIEVDLPIKRISAHAVREKLLRHGHLSTLHIWWARRPLAACRAVLCAALWPDPSDADCPPAFKKAASEIVGQFARQATSERPLAESCDPSAFQRWLTITRLGDGLSRKSNEHGLLLRDALLDLIGDFANWDNANRPPYVNAARALTAAAHEALGAPAGSLPLVVDPFAGGGTFPLEALRVGAEAHATDLNPVAVMLNKIALEYIPRYGSRLSAAVRTAGDWVLREAIRECGDLFPRDECDGIPLGYLWARQIRCEGPGCGRTFPLIRNTRITTDEPFWHYRIVADASPDVQAHVEAGPTGASAPTVAAGNATCPACGFTTPAKRVRAQLAPVGGGGRQARLLAVFVDQRGARVFRAPTGADLVAVELARQRARHVPIPHDELNPLRPYKNTVGLSVVTSLGIRTFSDLYNDRQAVLLATFSRLVLSAPVDGDDHEFIRAARTTLYCAVSRLVFQNCSLSRWHVSRRTIEGAFGKQALQIVWDFAESNPTGPGAASWQGALDWIIRVIEANSSIGRTGSVSLRPAQMNTLPDGSVDLLATDPPYFAAIPYSDLSNVFFVWERSLFKTFHPDLYSEGLVDQRDEIVVTNANLGRDGEKKTPQYFSREMCKALEVARRAVRPDGIGVIVFADSSTESWEAILAAVVDAGWMITASWPIDTELQNRTRAQRSASLQSSIHLVCRPRVSSVGMAAEESVGDWRNVLRELPERIHAWMPRLMSEGVVGADAIFACIGPALEVYSRYSRVERSSGSAVTLGEYLEQVWSAVSKEALSLVLNGADAGGLEADARLTAMWLWTLSSDRSTEHVDDDAESEIQDAGSATKAAPPVRYGLSYDAARKIAQGLGVHLDRLSDLVEIKGDAARLLTVSERARVLFGEPTRASSAGGTAANTQLPLFTTDRDFGTQSREREAPVPDAGQTLLDRLHQSMALFGSGGVDTLDRFLRSASVGANPMFWRLAQSLSALYPSGSEEKRWVDGVLGRKRHLGF